MLNHSKCLMYADDTVIYTSDYGCKGVRRKLQRDLHSVEQWCTRNQLSLNVKKTKIMSFMSDHRRKKAAGFRLYMKGNPIEEVTSYKYLGTTLDNRLSGESQYTKTTQTLGLKLRTFSKIRRFLSTRAALTVYNSTILPIIDYNDLFQMLWSLDKLGKLQKMQNWGLRIVYYDKNPKMSERELHQEAKVMILKNRRILHLLSTMYQRSLKVEYLDRRPIVTRQFDKVKFVVLNPLITKAFRSPNYLGSQLWDRLRIETQKSPSILVFKSQVKAHIAAGLFNNV